MEVKIGMRDVNREIVLESSQTPDEVAAAVVEALDGATLELSDDKGRRVIVPSAALAYVEIGADEQRRVGFGSVAG